MKLPPPFPAQLLLLLHHLLACASRSVSVRAWIFPLSGFGTITLHERRATFLNYDRRSTRSTTCLAATTTTVQDGSVIDDIILATSKTSNTPVVRKRILKKGSSDSSPPPPNSQVTIEYVGILASLQNHEEFWTPQDVVECWLSQQQGLPETLPQVFIKEHIDSDKLLDVDFFTEEYIAQKLGVTNKIQCKKLVMAAKRLAKDRMDYQATSSTVFDSSIDRGRPYTFPLGQNKAIRAMDIAVASMTLGETCQIIARCDYAYGKEGLRSSKGDTRVPPFATLKFEITLLDIQE
ncbi:FKBP-type peptidyl-prolyl cis-trans isomerase [Nitzschia inconspicua]|uniref:peptidylprolyl isomerase n=1 Tax=Nitzschia inconspicua TaxID=303405 RepID=A0A9K3M0L7_9STRA|nr:FKBP-type peptidyl-prolyl cis-trans isomerase [Nitzschia inconspicua]KAG7371717.1 FKBP-type peptidyl-prolyl cis-trans isomerase [Nitzschia inconspicua]